MPELIARARFKTLDELPEDVCRCPYQVRMYSPWVGRECEVLIQSAKLRSLRCAGCGKDNGQRMAITMTDGGVVAMESLDIDEGSIHG